MPLTFVYHLCFPNFQVPDFFHICIFVSNFAPISYGNPIDQKNSIFSKKPSFEFVNKCESLAAARDVKNCFIWNNGMQYEIVPIWMNSNQYILRD